MKLVSQMPSSTSLIPSLWPASTVDMLILSISANRRGDAFSKAVRAALTQVGCGQKLAERDHGSTPKVLRPW